MGYGPVAAGVMALVGVWLGHSTQAKTAREEREAVYLRGENDRAAEALGQLLVTMSALQPDTLPPPEICRIAELQALALPPSKSHRHINANYRW